MKRWLICAGFLLLSTSSFAQCRRGDSHVHFKIRKISNAGLKMHEASDEKALREYLIAKDNIFFLSTPKSAGAYLVLEPNYLNDRQFHRQAQDIADALEGVPEITGRTFAGLPITYYIFQADAKRPTSFSDENGILPGRLGVMLTLSIINEDPTFHETTHLTEKNWSSAESETLSEGVADYVQRECRPGKAYSFNDKNSDPDRLTLAYLAGPHRDSFLEKFAAPANLMKNGRTLPNALVFTPHRFHLFAIYSLWVLYKRSWYFRMRLEILRSIRSFMQNLYPSFAKTG